jgi:hypothetical protein
MAIVRALLLFVMPVLAFSGEVFFKLKGGFFFPSDKDFRDIYGGGIMSGLEISAAAARNLELWVEAGYFAKTGQLTFTKETMKLRILPVGGGVRYIFRPKRPAFYMGAGVLYHRFREVSPLGTVDWGRPGALVEMGSSIRLTGNFIVDVFARSSYCRIEPADFRFNIGGYDLGIRLAYEY